ncbi:MAG: permease-like cell division protein FtsX [Bacteroidota bacterium]
MAEQSTYGNSRLKPNYLYSIFSVALVLFLLGFFGMLLLQAQNLVISLKEGIELLLEVEETADQQQIATIEERLKSSSYTLAESVDYVSKEEAAEFMEAQQGFEGDLVKLDLPNPYYNSITFSVKAAYLQADSLRWIREELRADSLVHDVFYQENIVNSIADNVNRVGYIALGLSLFFLFVAFTLIHNTIRLALYANRFIVKNMQLVGASWEFISRPYILRALLHGLISGLIAIFALVLIMAWIQSEFPGLGPIQDYSWMTSLFITLLCIGMLINVFSTYYVVNKYLKMRLDDLY